VLPLGRKYYYAFDNVDDLGIHLEWSLEAVKEFDKLIDSGKDAVEIAKHFNRPIEDIVILALDRKIKRR
jgi:GDP-D-mannose dehydratase